ncbi:MaoC family dehydratase [Photobacterium sp. DNB23_23_1]
MVVKTPREEHSKLEKYNTEDWLYEDFEIGKKVKSISRTISEGEAMLFNSLVLDMHPYVGDQGFAENEGMFGKRLVAGAQVFAYGLGLMANNNVNTFSYGYDKLRFIRPVFIGDTIYTVRTHKEKKPKNDLMGIITVSYEIFKNDGELVLYAEHLQTVKYRDPIGVKESKSIDELAVS